MKKNFTWILIGVFALVFATVGALGHCEIPCGIYDDSLRMKLIYEDIATIAKSIHEINHLEASGKNANQLVRWINNKESHADKLRDVITQYFMTQRLNPVSESAAEYKNYLAKLTTLHALLVEAMKAKQNSNPEIAVKLKELAERFDKLYFGQGK